MPPEVLIVGAIVLYMLWKIYKSEEGMCVTASDVHLYDPPETDMADTLRSQGTSLSGGQIVVCDTTARRNKSDEHIVKRLAEPSHSVN